MVNGDQTILGGVVKCGRKGNGNRTVNAKRTVMVTERLQSHHTPNPDSLQKKVALLHKRETMQGRLEERMSSKSAEWNGSDEMEYAWLL